MACRLNSIGVLRALDRHSSRYHYHPSCSCNSGHFWRIADNEIEKGMLKEAG